MSLDASVNGANSNAYADVAYADAYHAARSFNTEWASATTPQKEVALIWACRLLDKLNWASIRALQAQALRWPQMAAYDQDGWFVPQTVIHRDVKDANCEMALYLLREDRTLDQGAFGIEALKVGSIAINFDKTQESAQAIPDGVMELIAHFLVGGGALSSRTLMRT